MMIRTRIAVTMGALALTACTTAQVQQATQDAANSAAALSQLCTAGAPIVTGASAKTPDAASAAGILLTDATSVCTASGAVANALDPTGQTVTPDWLKGVLLALQTAAALEPIVLPVIATVAKA